MADGTDKLTLPSPFAGTLWEEPDRRRTLLVAYGSSCRPEVRQRGKPAESWGTQTYRKNSTMAHADKKFGMAAREAVLAERRNAAAIARRFSARAAAAIEAQDPLPEIKPL